MRRRLLLSALAVGLAVACSDPPAAPAPPIAGRYTLRLVDGAPLPVFATEFRTPQGAQTTTTRIWTTGGHLVLLDPEPDTLIFGLRADVTPDGGTTTTYGMAHFLPIKLRGDERCATDADRWMDPTCPDPRPVKRRGDSLWLELALPDTPSAEYLFVREGT